MLKNRLLLPGNIVTPVRHRPPESVPVTFILSSGYGNDQFHEAVQLAFIDLLDQYGIGWAQYVYTERCEENKFTDLYISTGVSTLSWMYEWVQQQRSSGSICLFGYSFGASITLEVALIKRVSAAVVVNAVFDYVDYRTHQLGADAMVSWRNDLITYLSYDGSPYPLGYRFIQEAEQQDLERRVGAIDCEVYAFQAKNDAINRPSHILALAKAS